MATTPINLGGTLPYRRDITTPGQGRAARRLALGPTQTADSGTMVDVATELDALAFWALSGLGARVSTVGTRVLVRPASTEDVETRQPGPPAVSVSMQTHDGSRTHGDYQEDENDEDRNRHGWRPHPPRTLRTSNAPTLAGRESPEVRIGYRTPISALPPVWPAAHNRNVLCANPQRRWHNGNVSWKLDSLLALLPLLSQEIVETAQLVTSAGRGESGDDDGSAGVREPRRPLHPAGSAAAAVSHSA